MNVDGVNQYQNYRMQTLCWDCANACVGCSWSRQFLPVKGWKATRTYGKTFDSYIVHECPEFVRDAYQGGVKRYKKQEVTK